MGMAASQARYLGLTARKTNVEYEGQQVNQQRTALANESAGLFRRLLALDVPTAPLYRAEIEYREKPVFGRSLAHTMLFDSNLKNFAGLLDYTITFYELTNFDEAELGFVRLPDLEDKK